MISRILFLALTALTLDSQAQKLPSFPTLSLPEGWEGVAVIRSAKVRQTFSELGVPWDTIKKTPLRAGFNPLPGMADERVSSMVFGVGAGGSGEFCLLSFTQETSMEEVLKADEVAGEATGEGDYRVVTKEGRTYRRFSPQEFLLTRNMKSGAPAQPAKDLSALRAAVAKQDCLILGVMSARAINSNLPRELKTPGDSVGDMVVGMMKPDGLRFFARSECSSEQFAMKLMTVARMAGPPAPDMSEVPEAIRPTLTYANHGRTAGIEFAFPRPTAGLGLAAMLSGMGNILAGSNKARAARDAQTIAAMANAALSAGCDQFDGVNSVEEIIAILGHGATPTKGPFAGQEFKAELRNNDPDHRKAVLAMLKLEEDGSLRYVAPDMEAGNRAAALLPGAAAAAAEAKARRNAQSIAAIFGAGRSTGALEVEQVKSEVEAVAAVARGFKGAGQFSTATFKVELTKAEQEAAMAWLDWDEAKNSLIYRGTDE
jgi:hypothetical protein